MNQYTTKLNLMLSITFLALLPNYAYTQTCFSTEVIKLLAYDGADGDFYGRSLCIDGDTAIIGAEDDDDNGGSSGSAYIYTRSKGTWSLQAKITPSDGAALDCFGASVSLSGDTAAIGADRDDDNGSSSGSVYIFKRNDNVWTQQVKLLPKDGAPGDSFGSSVSICGSTVVVGAYLDDDNGNSSGSAYLFSELNGDWNEEFKLLASDGESVDRYGWSVAIKASTVIVGSWSNNDFGSNSGSAYIYERVGFNWVEQAKLLPELGMVNDRFGWSVAIEGDIAVVGSIWDQNLGNKAGAVYVFSRNDSVWTQHSKLLPSDGNEGDEFGTSVSINNSIIGVGSLGGGNIGVSSGSAYIFSLKDEIWYQQSKLVPSDGLPGETFGGSISVSGSSTLVGSQRDDDNGSLSGSAYIFETDCALCKSDINSDNVLDYTDVDQFIMLFENKHPFSDWNKDSIWDFFDISGFLQSYQAGCP